MSPAPLPGDVKLPLDGHSSEGESASIAVAAEKTVNIVKAVKLPSKCFSSPVVFRGSVYLGCRDDYLYCLT